MKTLLLCPLDFCSFVFVGKKALTGIPHPKTAQRSVVGNYYYFETVREAKEFAAIQKEINDEKIIQVGSPDELRRYSLGISINSYIEHLKFVMSPSLLPKKIEFEF